MCWRLLVQLKSQQVVPVMVTVPILTDRGLHPDSVHHAGRFCLCTTPLTSYDQCCRTWRQHSWVFPVTVWLTVAIPPIYFCIHMRRPCLITHRQQFWVTACARSIPFLPLHFYNYKWCALVQITRRQHSWATLVAACPRLCSPSTAGET